MTTPLPKFPHITAPVDCKPLAWHSYLDVAAVRLADGREELLVKGHIVDRSWREPNPCQSVVELCRAMGREEKSMMARFRRHLGPIAG